MIVVSDTGPLNYLLRLEAIEILPRLYGSVLIPETVRQELLHPNAPAVVLAWAAHLPEWASLGQPQTLLPQTLLRLALDAGELAAISLAVERNADLLLMDDLRGRQAAMSQKLKIIGTLGILATAARSGLLDFNSALTRLRQTGFHVSEEVVRTLPGNQAPE